MPKTRGKPGPKASITGNPDSLRRRAEEFLSRDESAATGSVELKELLHELTVHQIELDLQNQELRRACDDAESARERYFNLYDLAPIGYAGFDQFGRIADINLTGAKMIGVERRDCTGRPFRTFIETGDWRTFDAFLLKVFRTGNKESCTVTIPHAGMPPGTLRIEGILADRPGDPTICRAALLDISEQKTTEQELVNTSRYLATLIESATGPIVVWDTQHRITLFNKGFERLTGRSAESVIEKPLEILFPAEERERAMARVRIADGGIMESIEIPVVSIQGTKIVLWNAAALHGQDGQWMATIAQGQDISELKTTERDLRVKIDELDALNAQLTEISKNLKGKEEKLTDSLAEKEILLAEIHHRVKNNLASFISLISLDGSYEDTPSGRQLRNDLQNRARTMALIHETLYRTRQFSRVDMEDYLTTLVRQVVGSCKSAVPVEAQVDARGITLDLGRAMPVGLIVNELLTNAIKYAWPHDYDSEKVRGEPPTIVVGMSRNGDGYILSVRDNGIGLSESIDPAQVRTLGLKLVFFLAKHQLHTLPEMDRDRGTGFVFRIPERGKAS